MEQNPNNQNTNQQQNQKPGNQNTRPQAEGRYPGRDRKFSQDRNAVNGSRADKNPGADKDQVQGNDKPKNPDDTRYAQKGRDRNAGRGGKQQSQAFKQNTNGSSGGHNRYGRNTQKGAPHSEGPVRHIKPKRIETIEDIQADIERIDKDIQFEIKQIKAVKLGL